MPSNQNWPEDHVTQWVVTALEAAARSHTSPAFRTCARLVLERLDHLWSNLEFVPTSWPALEIVQEAMDMLALTLQPIRSPTWQNEIAGVKSQIVDMIALRDGKLDV